MQALPEVTPRKEPTEITGSLFAVMVVIPLNYPRANQCSRTIGERPDSGRGPDYQEDPVVRKKSGASQRHTTAKFPTELKPTRKPA